MVTSDDEGTSSHASEEVIYMYRCKHCPGQEFTAAERDTHRLQHRRLKQKSSRDSPPVTLFEEIPQDEENTSPRVEAPSPKRPRSPSKRGKKALTVKKGKKHKVRSTKKFDPQYLESPPSSNGG